VRKGCERGEIRLSIADRGCGMPLESGNVSWDSKNATPGVEIQGMKERVRKLRGRFEIRSGKKGTTVMVALPLSARSTAVDGGETAHELAHSARG